MKQSQQNLKLFAAQSTEMNLKTPDSVSFYIRDKQVNKGDTNKELSNFSDRFAFTFVKIANHLNYLIILAH